MSDPINPTTLQTWRTAAEEYSSLSYPDTCDARAFTAVAIEALPAAVEEIERLRAEVEKMQALAAAIATHSTPRDEGGET